MGRFWGLGQGIGGFGGSEILEQVTAIGVVLPADIGRGFGETIQALGGGMDDLKSSLDSYMTSYQSAVQGAMTPSQAMPDVEAIMGKAGVYMDKWDEWAKRAADVANLGLASPWVPELAKAGIDVTGLSDPQVKAAAALGVQEFYEGYFPSLINWDAVSARMGQDAQTKLNWENILATAPVNLEEGVQPGAPLMMAAFDFAGMGQTGATDFATTFHDTLLGQDWKGGTGSPIAQAIMSGAGAAMKTPSTAFANDMRSYVIGVVKAYFFPEGALP